MRIYKENEPIKTSKHSLTVGNTFYTSFPYMDKLIIISKKDISKTLHPRYDVYYNTDYIEADSNWNDVELICQLTATIPNTLTMDKVFKNCYTSMKVSDSLINLILEKINEV